MSICLVCRNPAKELPSYDYDGRLFDCVECGRYNVAGSVECKLERLPLEQRENALKKAKRFPKDGGVPTIDGRCI